MVFFDRRRVEQRRVVVVVVVHGPAGPELVRALWASGLRPVSGDRPGSLVWKLPEGVRR
ncbi:MAG: hypothetical protein ACRDPG_08105 [Nocardioidaceae bacterium]